MDAAVHEVQFCREMQLSLIIIQTIKKSLSCIRLLEPYFMQFSSGRKMIADLISMTHSSVNIREFLKQ